MININHAGQFPRRGGVRGALLVLAASSLGLPAFGQKIFYESFDGVPLGPNVEEASFGTAVWTKTPPTGWTIDDSQMPGFGTPEYAANDGRREWAGWSFADVRWWPTVDNQRRAEFVRASGAAAIADPDEWDDAGHIKGLFNSFLRSVEIDIAGKAANSLVVAFDSSWRDECCDDPGASFPTDENGQAINNQTAIVTASFDGGAPVEILKWDSDSESPTFHDDNPNESVIVALNNPAGAQKVVLTFALVEAANDWWWAFDNLAIGELPMVNGATATGVGFTVRIGEGMGETVNDAAAITATLDGQAVTVTKERAETEVLVSYDQSPTLFQPRSRHDVTVRFTAGDGRQITDTASFTAPGYASATATPSAFAAVITEQTYFQLDESKGITLKLDGTTVTASSVTREDLTDANTGEDLPDRITIRYNAPAPFVSDSVHSLELTYTTRAGQVLTETVGFKVPRFATLPASLATAIGTGAEPGMRWRTHQATAEAARPESVAGANGALAGQYGASIHDPSGEAANGYFNIDYVNFDQNGADAGRFNGSSSVASQAIGDELIPGIPGPDGSTDEVAGEALAYVEIPAAGVYTMVVNSDDGFQLSMGNATNPQYLVLGAFDGTRGQADTLIYFSVTQPGVYLFRMLWFEGGSDARVEWFTGNADGERALVNGPTTTGVTPLKAFRRRSVAEPELPATAMSIGLNFGADQPNSAVAAGDLAGVPGVAQKNWNNLSGQSGTTNNVVGDAGGTAVATAVQVVFTSNNTWASTGAGEENNQFTGADKTLMTGYLDTGDATTSTVTITGLPASFASAGYDVYVYALGGVAAGRAGAYRVTDPAGTTVIEDYVRATSSTNPSSYVEVIPSGTTYAVGNYLVFDGLNAAGLRIEATTANGLGAGSPPRAPINAIQLVSPPTYVPAPTLSVARDGANIRVTWSAGSLEGADSVTGPWTVVPGVTSPAAIPATAAQKYYRARN